MPLRRTKYDVNPPIESAQRWGRFTSADWLQESAEEIGYGLAVWGEATGQDQGWNMFTPGFPPHTVVLAAEFRFPDGSVDRSYSRFNPGDPARPIPRWPIIDDREFNFEANIFMLAWECDPQSIDAQPERWRQLPERVRENEHLVAAWLRWQLKRYRESHPEKPEPEVVTLVLRYIPTPLPGEPRRLDAPAGLRATVRAVAAARCAAGRIHGPGGLRSGRPAIRAARDLAAPMNDSTPTPTKVVGIQPRFPGALNRWGWLTRPVAAERVAALRIATALALLLDIFASLLPHFGTFFSPEALGGRDQYPWRFREGHLYWSFLRVLPDAWGPQLVMGVWIVAALALLVGYRPFLSGLVCWSCAVSFWNINPWITNGGDQLRNSLLFVVAFCRSGAVWGVQSVRRGGDAGPVLVPGWPVKVLIVQLCCIYFFSGIHKLRLPAMARRLGDVLRQSRPDVVAPPQPDEPSCRWRSTGS